MWYHTCSIAVSKEKPGRYVDCWSGRRLFNCICDKPTAVQATLIQLGGLILVHRNEHQMRPVPAIVHSMNLLGKILKETFNISWNLELVMCNFIYKFQFMLFYVAKCHIIIIFFYCCFVKCLEVSNAWAFLVVWLHPYMVRTVLVLIVESKVTITPVTWTQLSSQCSRFQQCSMRFYTDRVAMVTVAVTLNVTKRCSQHYGMESLIHWESESHIVGHYIS